MIEVQNYDSLPPLFKCVVDGDLDGLRLQVEAGATLQEEAEIDIDHVLYPFNLVQLAAVLGRLGIIEYLLNLTDLLGEVVFNPAADGNAAIRFAAEFGHLPVVQYLAELRNTAGELVCNPAANDNHAIRFAAENGHLQVVQYLTELRNDNGEYVCNPTDFDNWAICYAASNGHKKTALYLYDVLYERGIPVVLEDNEAQNVRAILRQRNEYAHEFTRAFHALSEKNSALCNVAHLVSQHCDDLSFQDGIRIEALLRELPKLR